MLERSDTAQFVKKLEFIRFIEPPVAEVIDRECDRFCITGAPREGYELSDVQAIYVRTLDGQQIAIVTILVRNNTAHFFDILTDYERPADEYFV